MDNYIIIGIIVLLAVIAIGTLVKRSGRKGCCGSGSDYKPRKKKLKNVIATKIFVVDGMHCEKCANRVTEVVNDITGGAGVVDLKKGIVKCPTSRKLLTSRSRRESNGLATPLRKSDSHDLRLSRRLD